MSFTPFRVGLLIALVAIALPSRAHAGFWELSGGFNYTHSTYNGGSFSWTRKWGGSLGYNFNDMSTMEFGFQQSYERDHFEGFEDSSYNDQVYSVNWVQNLLGKEAVIQPYFKLGVGQLIRTASIVDSLNRSQVQHLSQVTGVLGAGFRIHLTQTFAIRIEGTSYIPKMQFDTWKDNFSFMFGASLYF